MAGDVRTDSAGIPQAVDADWFREPTRREHWIAAWLFVGFGVFFVLLFLLFAGSWFRWVLIGLAVISVLYAFGHVRDLRHDPAMKAAEDHRQ